ncbi:hypothetical protein SAMN05216555_101337 [Arthrobacter cupressi]|uniref:Uncharacterized protein n=2 Tax=Arthrobacter cupressi TaxID=1045773 RepID=A0A1G8IS95_9MICC|nr:hypothetical protein SAMN05216555_101337 [Arthrobacter cupressi]
MGRYSAESGAGISPDMSSTFRNLCRSSPWKWTSLRFEYRDLPGDGSGPLKAWLRRPGALRLENADGVLLHSTTGINDSRDSFYVRSSRSSWLLPAHLVTPVYDGAGLVRRRPEAAYGEPSFGNGRLAAALDPVELAGNAPVPIEFPESNPVALGAVREVDHEGRPALESVVVPGPNYSPADPGSPLCLPGRTRLRIDTATGVCVASEALDDGAAGTGHWIRILGVDEYMLDDLFLAESMNLSDVRQHITWEPGA